MKEPKELFEWIREHPLQVMFDSRYSWFSSGYGITGLVYVEPGRISFLAVHSSDSGKGNFGRFLERCERDYGEVRFLHVWNEWLGRKLVGRGYHPNTEPETDGTLVTALVWKK